MHARTRGTTLHCERAFRNSVWDITGTLDLTQTANRNEETLSQELYFHLTYNTTLFESFLETTETMSVKKKIKIRMLMLYKIHLCLLNSFLFSIMIKATDQIWITVLLSDVIYFGDTLVIF